MTRREPEEVARLLRAYAESVERSPHNLLSPRGLAELGTRHVPEAIAFSEGLPRTSRLLDIGSGGGLPGIVIAITRPDLEVHLMEATGKKATFLSEVAEQLGLRVVVHHGRAEELARPPLAGSFDLVTARAVAPLERLVPWAEPYLGPKGQLHAIKGERWGEELDAARPIADRLGLRVVARPGRTRGDLEPLVVVLGRK